MIRGLVIYHQQQLDGGGHVSTTGYLIDRVQCLISIIFHVMFCKQPTVHTQRSGQECSDDDDDDDDVDDSTAPTESSGGPDSRLSWG